MNVNFYGLNILLGSMANQNFREVLHTTSRLRQQLLEAVDRLESSGGRDHQGLLILVLAHI